MYDLHSHILAGIDDGARDLAESLEIARIAVASGVLAMAATPHSSELLQYDYTAAFIQARVEHLQAELRASDIPLTVYAGAEVFAEHDTVTKIKDGRLATINNTRYVLLEPPFDSLPVFFERLLFDLQTSGYVPVLAHPERNAAVIHDPALLYGWSRRGILAQVSTASLLGGFGSRVRETARLLVQRHWVHLVASDAHHPIVRPPGFALVLAELRRLAGEDVARRLTVDVPEAILADRVPDLQAPEEPEAAHKSIINRVLGH
jgi:tyrosine-protein phosphatase YwqE